MAGLIDNKVAEKISFSNNEVNPVQLVAARCVNWPQPDVGLNLGNNPYTKQVSMNW